MKNIVLFISMFSPIIAIWSGRKTNSTLWYYAIVCLVSDLVSYLLKQMDVKHALVSNFFLISEFLLVTVYFKTNLLPDKYKRVFITGLSLVSIVYAYNTFERYVGAANDSQAYNYIDASFFYIVYIICSLLGFYTLISNVSTVSIERSHLFWACIAFLLYASGVLFLLIFKDNATIEDMDMFKNLWTYFFKPLNIIKNLLIALSLHYASTATDNKLV